jgi:hypothetical protein
MKILLDKKEYELGDLTLSQYMKVKQIQESGKVLSDAEFISLLTNIPLHEVREATIPQINFVSKVLNSWFSNLTTKQPLKQLINYKGQMLGLTQPSNMTWGEFTDLEVLASQETMNLKHLAAILYRPCETYNVNTLERKIVKYNYDECVERSKDMEDFPIGDIFSAVFFFMKYAQLLINKEKNSMGDKMKMMTELKHQTKEPKTKS